MSDEIIIYRYCIRITDEQSLLMPKGANILNVAMKSGALCLWASVNPNADLEKRTIAIYVTGHPLPENPGDYIGMFMSHDDTMVWHVFDRT